MCGERVLALERKVTGGAGADVRTHTTGHMHATFSRDHGGPTQSPRVLAPSSQEPPGRGSVRCLQRHGPRVEE